MGGGTSLPPPPPGLPFRPQQAREQVSGQMVKNRRKITPFPFALLPLPQARVCAEGGVAKGHELYAAYVNPDAPREQRQAHLLERYGFICRCERCRAVR
jgi:hypothetical protein